MASEAENPPEAPEEPSPFSPTEIATKHASNLRNQLDLGSVFGGMVLAIGFLFLAEPIRQSNAIGVLDHNLSPVFVTLYVALSAGHYLGLSITGSDNNFIDGAFGGFIVFSVAVSYWSINSGMNRLPIALLGIFLGLVMAHHRGWVQENKPLDVLLEVFGRGVVPLGLVGAVLVEILVPLVFSTQIDEFLGSLDSLVLAALLMVVTAALYVLGQAIGQVENYED